MGDEKEPKMTDTRTTLLIILVLCFCFLFAEFTQQRQNAVWAKEPNWASKITYNNIYQTTDQPKISITRLGAAIEVRYLGGQDKGFIGDFRITIDNETTYYKNPGAHNVVALIEHWKITCVDVEAMDKAVRTYRPIGSACL